MQIRRLALQQFRNIASAQLDLSGRLQFLLGPNGQGKTNLLEATGLITALRSFRSAETRHLIAHGQTEAALACTLEHEIEGETKLTIKLKPGAKEVWLEATKLTRLADFIGRFPTVVFSSQDQQLLRGSPGGRRRWLDLTLAAMDAGYLKALQRYHRALAERNALLKSEASDAQLTAFEQVLAEHGEVLISSREVGLQALANSLTEAYSQIADNAEPTGFAYAPDISTDAAGLRAKLAKNRGRDRMTRTTSSGPHRDDFEFTLRGRAAKDFASEGQQRALLLSLRLAQASWFRDRSGVQPVLLADDVLGELDPVRRARFWAAVPETAQVIATGTVEPGGELGDWQVFRAQDGNFPHLE
jgi:DNA replication and repair protein RecF